MCIVKPRMLLSAIIIMVLRLVNIVKIAMIINEFFMILVASKRLRVGWGEKEKGPTMMIALELLSWQLCHYID